MKRKHKRQPPTEAERAQVTAVVNLAKSEALDAEVRRVTNSLRELREVYQLERLLREA